MITLDKSTRTVDQGALQVVAPMPLILHPSVNPTVTGPADALASASASRCPAVLDAGGGCGDVRRYFVTMAKRDLDKSASRFLNALRRTGAGMEKQRERILDRAANAPRLLPNSPYEVINLTGDDGNDLDYYIYELARLQDLGKSIIKVFGQPQELVDAQAVFDAGIPNLRVIRNPLTHPNDNDELDEVAFFSSVVNLKPDGKVQELVDPRYQQHDEAMAYHAALTSYLRTRIRNAIAVDPPQPLRPKTTDT